MKGKLARILCSGLAAGLTLALAACSGGGSAGTGGGTASFSLTDAPACGGQFQQVVVTIAGIEVTGNGAAPYTLTLDKPIQQNLLDLTNGKFANLGPIPMPAGTYNQTRLILAANAPGTGGTPANYVVTPDGATHALKTPSAQQSGFKVIGPFTVNAGNTVGVMVDFDACRSVVNAGNSGQYILKPVLHAIVQDTAGFITGALGTTGAGAVVYAEDASGLTFKSTVADSNGDFNLSPLPATGTTGAPSYYNVVVTPPQPVAPNPVAVPDFTPGIVINVPVTANQGTIISTDGAPLLLQPATTSQTYTGTLTLATPDADTLVVARQPVINGANADTVTFAQTMGVPAVASGNTTSTYSLTFPAGQPNVATYVAGSTPTFPPPTSTTSPTITVSAFGSDGSTGTAASATSPNITMSGTSDTTYQNSH